MMVSQINSTSQSRVLQGFMYSIQLKAAINPKQVIATDARFEFVNLLNLASAVTLPNTALWSELTLSSKGFVK